jgi:DNA-binding transcriptional LysR family regulator
MIDLDSLNCLELAATHGSFTAASRKAHLSLAAFSDRIRRLEEHLGTPLFVRGKRGARLTPFGQRLLGQARRCLLEARRCEAMAWAEAQQGGQVVTLGAAIYPGVWRIAPALQTLHARHPDIRVHLRLAPGRSLLEALLLGDVDLIVASHSSAQAHAAAHHAVRMVELWDEPYVLVGSTDLLAERPLRCAADAESHALLDTGPELDTFRLYLELLPASPPWRFGVAHYLSVYDAMHELALRGLGVAVLPEDKVSAHIASGRLQKVLPQLRPPRRLTCGLWLRQHARATEIAALLQTLSESIGALVNKSRR